MTVLQMRLVVEVDDYDEALRLHRDVLVAPPTRTPWDSLNARLEAPADLRITLFEELGD